MDISIIIPAYNVEKYLERCIDSLLNQTFKGEFEIIVIDDGSTDDTGVIGAEYAKKYKEIVYIRKNNGGQSQARNIGINVSKGEYIAFVDSDDYVEATYLETLYNLCKVNSADISMCCANRCYGSDGVGNKFESGFSDSFASDDINYILENSSFAPWAKLYKKQLIAELRFPIGMTYEDFALIPQIIYRAKKIAYVEEQLYHYYMNTNSTITNRIKMRKADRNIFRAMQILEISELQANQELLENFYLRRVLLSLVYSMLEYGEEIEEIKKYVNYGLDKYPNIAHNSFISSLSLKQRFFLYLILSNHYSFAKEFVSTAGEMKYILKRILKIGRKR